MSTASGPTPPEPPEGRPPGPTGPEPTTPGATDPGTSTPEPQGRTEAWRPEEYAPRSGVTRPDAWGQGRPEGSQDNTPSWNTGAPAREGASVGLVVVLGAAGFLALLLVIALLAYLALKTVDFGGGDEPGPTGGVEQTSESTRGATGATAEATAQESRSAASSAPATSAPAPVAVKGAQELGVPSGKPLFRRTGTLEKTAIDDEEENSIPVPAHDGPILVVWSSTGSDGGQFYVNGHEKKGGQLSESLPAVRPGGSGTALINTGGYKRTTGVLYAQGGKGAQWEVRGYALSAVPEVERGKPVTGTGPRVFRVPAGTATDYRLSVAEGEDWDYPMLKVYAADDLTTTESSEYKSSAPVDLDVSMDGGEKIVVVQSEQQWIFTAR